jgi:hypothetical protein
MQQRITLAYIERMKDVNEMKSVEHVLAETIRRVYHSVRKVDKLFGRRDFLSLEKRWHIVRIMLASEDEVDEHGIPYRKMTLWDVIKF